MTTEEQLLSNFRIGPDGNTYRVNGSKPLEGNKPSAGGYILVGTKLAGKKTNVYLHRLKFLLRHGYLPPVVDHKNTKRCDNPLSNLRAATKAQNNCNHAAVGHAGLPRGVYLKKDQKRIKRYEARPHVGGKLVSLGHFHTPEEASEVVERALAHHRGEFYRNPASNA